MTIRDNKYTVAILSQSGFVMVFEFSKAGLNAGKRTLLMFAMLLILLGQVTDVRAGAVKAAAKKTENPFDAPMRFWILRSGDPGCEPLCAEWIYAMGQITPDTIPAFKAVLKEAGDRKLPLLISSPGGRVDIAMQMGRLVRKRKMNVEVAQTRFPGCSPSYLPCAAEKQAGFFRGYALTIGSFCWSACPLVLAGGIRRVTGPLAHTGVHQITTVRREYQVEYREKYRIVSGKKKVVGRKAVKRRTLGTSTSTKLSKAMRRQLLGYFSEMGIDAKLLDAMMSTPPTGIRRLTMDELSNFGLATEISMPEVFTVPGVCTLQPAPQNCIQRNLGSAMQVLPAPQPATR